MSDNYEKQYTPTDWMRDQIISETLMDHAEKGISDAYKWLADLEAIVNNATTEQEVETIINSKGFATTDQLPTKVSDLTNDAGYITEEQVPEGFFIATYGTTTYADVLAAYQSGKAIICKKNNTTNSTITYLTFYDSDASTFYFDNFRLGMTTHYMVSSSGGWAYSIVHYVGTSRTINNKALSSNITLTAADVGATTSTQVQTMIDDALAAIPVADQTVYAQSNS